VDKRSVTIKVNTPFSLKATVLSHGWHECAPMSWSEGGRCLQVIDREGAVAHRVSVAESRRTAKAVTLSVTVEAPDPAEPMVQRVAADVRCALSLDDELGGFFELCDRHEPLRVIPTIGAGRAIRSRSMTENIVKALCATNVNWTQAVKMINRIAQLGPHFAHFRNLNAWPTPREILRAGEKYLLEVCRVGYRSDSILALCRDVCDGRFDPDGLDALARNGDMDSDDLLDRLRSIRGIGPSSAHYLLSFMGRHDRMSIDSATIAYMARTHFKGKKPTNRQIERRYARFGPWKNKVWWFEQWLGWGTARQILREAGVTQPGRHHAPHRSGGIS
jgi:N-glycosylase/DNA lyase